MDRISEILEEIGSIHVYNENSVHRYIELVKEAIDEIDKLEAKPTSMLDNAKQAALYELRNELTNRMNPRVFFKMSIERRKSDFKISKALGIVAIENLVANL